MQFARGDMTGVPEGACGDGRCADGVWKRRGIGRVCRAGGVRDDFGCAGQGGCLEVRGKSRSCCQAWGVARGGRRQVGGRMPGLEMGHGVRAGPERPARSAELSWEGSRGGGHSFFPVFGRRCCGRCRAGMAAAFLLAAAGAAGRRALSNCLASFHVCFVPLRLFDPCGGRVAATAHVRHKSGKSGFPAVAESAFLLFVYLRYFCRDTAPATGSNSS